MGNTNPIAVFENGELHLNVRIDQANDTVWLTQEQMAQLFDVTVSSVSRHISNIYHQKELDSMTTSSKMELVGDPNVTGKRTIALFNLDVILSVGYRVNSQKGIEFRHWSSSILKSYLVQGYAINEKRLLELEKKVKIFEIATRNKDFSSEEKGDFFDLLSDFEQGLILLDDYDHEAFPAKPKGEKDTYHLSYEECRHLIDQFLSARRATSSEGNAPKACSKGRLGRSIKASGAKRLIPPSRARRPIFFISWSKTTASSMAISGSRPPSSSTSSRRTVP
jgi:hypothetical protein